jgi:hypothetical protein
MGFARIRVRSSGLSGKATYPMQINHLVKTMKTRIKATGSSSKGYKKR